MNNSILTDGRARFSRTLVLLAATLAALTVLVTFAHARSSEAQDSQTVTINPSDIGFGAVELTASPETRTVSVTNTGTNSITIGSVDFSGLVGTGTANVTATLDPGGLIVGAGETKVFTVSFDPLTAGYTQLSGTLKDTLGGTIAGAPQVTVSGTGVSATPAGSADCTIMGTSRSETLTGTSNHDVICGKGGNDRINGQGGNDDERGGAGNDRITDHNGKDKLLGQGGRDTLNARDHARGDVLKGGAGKDRAIKDKRDRARGI